MLRKNKMTDEEMLRSANLIDSYDRLIRFGQKHLNDLFVLDGIQNMNARDRILREIISNTLAHRDYSSGFPAKMIIDEEKIVIENSNLAHGIGELNLFKFEPFSKNPPISKVFREIGLADELGSGMRNTYKFTELYSSEKPIFEEGNIFKTIVPIKTIATKKVGIKDVVQDVAQKKEEILAIILHEIKRNPKISRKKIAEKVGVSVKTIERYIKGVQNLKFIGKGSNGYWKFEE